jgi:hypothetical protein
MRALGQIIKLRQKLRDIIIYRDLYLKKMVLIARKRGIHGENPV